jgi:hypothetical protein
MTRLLSWALALSLTGASGAWAAKVVVRAPFSDDVCRIPIDVTGSLSDPHSFYSTSPHCPALCKHAAADCRQFVKDAFSCQITEQARLAFYDRETCAPIADPAQRKACDAAAAADRAVIRTDLDAEKNDALNSCASWLTTCVSTCGTL